MKQVEVQIMGQGYVLGCPEGGETRLQQAVQSVDQAMSKIRDAGKIKARDRIAVLAALNLAFDLADRPAAAATTASSDPATDDHALQDLLHRLDAALGEDGQLL
jgi:cell division protein ZapA